MSSIGFILQASSEQYGIADVFIWSLVLIALLMLAFAGVGFIRRWMRDDENNDGPGFLLDDLRAMLANGTISREEFDKAKAQMTAAMQRAEDRKKAEQEAALQSQVNVWDTAHMRERRRVLDEKKKQRDGATEGKIPLSESPEGTNLPPASATDEPPDESTGKTGS